MTDSYRNYGGQVNMKKKYGGGAAHPGRSNHGWGLALDIQTYNGIKGDSENPYRSIANAGRNGGAPNNPVGWLVPKMRTDTDYPGFAYEIEDFEEKYQFGTDWNFKGAGFYTDSYYWMNFEAGKGLGWINPSYLRQPSKSGEPWHYNYKDIASLFSGTEVPETPAEDGGS
jgi:hypothetical protein